jgi:hypothetical protein
LWARTEKYKKNLMKISHVPARNSLSAPFSGSSVEFGSPDCNGPLECFMYNKSNTLRISTNSIFTGDYLQIGSRQDINITICSGNSSDPCVSHNPSSYIFVNGIIEEECPFVMNSNSSTGMEYYSRICLGKPKATGTLLLPDTNGIFITSGNTEDVHSLVGLRGNRYRCKSSYLHWRLSSQDPVLCRSFVFTGTVHRSHPYWKFKPASVDPSTEPLPPIPRISCNELQVVMRPSSLGRLFEKHAFSV